MSRDGRKKRLVLQVRLEDEVVETRSEPPFLARTPKSDLRRMTLAIRRAANDRRVGALILRFAHPEIGWAKAASLARAIRAFRSAGKPPKPPKPVVAFLEGAGNLDYTLACSCDVLIAHPGATLDLVGLQAESFYFKDMLDRMGIEAELDAVGEYKSAAERFTRRDMSEAHREAVGALLADLSEQMELVIAERRGLSAERVRRILDDGPYLAQEALELGLVDRIGQEDSCESHLREMLGVEVIVHPHTRYPTRDGWLRRMLGFRRPQVAVVYAVGVITSTGARRASPSPRIVSPRGLGELLTRVRKSRRVKAVVLRVDSPGGAAVASDLIWKEVARTREEKPVIVSMGDVAASGGYYIATAADAILAEPSTLTGSIGIVGGKVVARRLLDMLGIHRETLSLHRRAGFRSPTRPFTSDERAKIREHLRFFYEKLFVPRVAEGRRLSLEAVEEVARGRVWTGRQGKERGLVDELGDLEDAVSLARRKAGIPPEQKVNVVTYAKRPRLRELLSVGVPWGAGSSAVLPGLPVSSFSNVAELVASLVSEDVLFLMPWILRIR
ncbi:MAG: signal peptide peptidase SppA [Vicinamibacteria bacterium]